MRDTQKSRVYRAEQVLRPVLTRRYETLADLQRRVDAIVGSAYWRRHFPKVTHITVADGRGARHASAYYRSRKITMPKWARNEATLLHEVAHIAASSIQHPSKHGWLFCATYLKLVRRFGGKAAHDALRASFKAHRVRYTRPRAKRVLSEAQKAVLRERLAAVRRRTVDAAAGPRGAT